MTEEIFSHLITRLVQVETASNPLISCFVNLEQSRSGYIQALQFWAETTKQRLTDERRIGFENALSKIRHYLANEVKPSAKSVAIYSRACGATPGDLPVFLPMQFEVPLTTDFIISDLPHIYPLIDTLSANPREGLSPILAESINLFIAMENWESHNRNSELASVVFSNGLGVCGYEDSIIALEEGAASMLVIDQNLKTHIFHLCITKKTNTMIAPKTVDLVSAEQVLRYCEVTKQHIDEMYDRMESGMCDVSTCNAVALALSGAEGGKFSIRYDHEVIYAQQGRKRYSLSPHLLCWMSRLHRGLPVSEVGFFYAARARTGLTLNPVYESDLIGKCSGRSTVSK